MFTVTTGIPALKFNQPSTQQEFRAFFLGRGWSKHEAELPPSLIPKLKMRSYILPPSTSSYRVAQLSTRKTWTFVSEFLIILSIIKIRTQAGNQSFNDSLLCEESLFSSEQAAVAFPDTNLLDAQAWVCLRLQLLRQNCLAGCKFERRNTAKWWRIVTTLFKSRSLWTVVCDKMERKFQNWRKPNGCTQLTNKTSIKQNFSIL
jgi:hypothetical protein